MICDTYLRLSLNVSIVGSYSCSCLEGYEKDDANCVDQNECLTGDLNTEFSRYS